MSWRIVMIEQGEYLRLKLDNLFVKRGKDEYTIPLSDISVVVVSNLQTALTVRLLDVFSAHNISLVTCDYKHQPSGLFTGLHTHSRVSKMVDMQIAWGKEFKDITWSLVVKSKIKNQRDILDKFHFDGKSVELIDGYLKEILPGDSTNREGHCAKVYFNSLFGKGFSRRDDEDIKNACLNYGYSIVRGFFARLIVGYGFIGMIGLHHKNEYNSFNLVDDLMEPFRPLLDEYVLGIIKEDTVFDFEIRYSLVDFLHTTIQFEGKKMLMANVMDKYVQSFVRYCKTGEIMTFPKVDYGDL